ncbi:MAG: hypothetical protein ABI261_05400 [Ginsengibacter sp.]
MKKLLFFCFLFQSLLVFSQTKPAQPVVTDADTFGYVDGIRMDSINAEYAQFEWGAQRLFFNYGQMPTRKNTTVTDEKGDPLKFSSHSISFTLNFLYFNGWEFTQAYYSNKTDIVVLKKRHDK